MARHLTEANVRAICEMIDGWDRSTPLTWNNVVAAVEGLLGHKYSRQALEARERIKGAYRTRLNVLKNLPERAPKGSVELMAAQARIDKFRAENARLEAENERLLQQFVRWLYNAKARGLDEATLNQALPPVDKEQTRKSVIEAIRNQPRK
ncbi:MULTISPECIES: hypothetical protein [Alphaproteobacteria]|uniref:Uncharacterized protein n=1 Tax=Roseomonas genomospecies 6 TaxID=214106 RepID=A0A9W7NG80_9PROT|nr:MULTISPECIES: hypothetical protein [Rhodospirillales]AWJ86265.1 hypothetical protein TSH58p_22335 [Azospirillum sp. TSH58]KAA0675730.1 hypothetical protein DS843_30245 [Roseomonas genomospecies 6]PWC69819.1 hypothetical protein TSH58_14775 [Azospirillum sp. TSH58]